MDPLNISITTFNCARTPVSPVSFSTRLLSTFPRSEGPSNAHRVFPDLLILSLQEVAPLSYSFLGSIFLASYFSRFHEAISLLSRHQAHEGESQGYTHVITRNVGLTATMVFVQKGSTAQVLSLETAGVGTGVWEMGNKGAVGAKIGWAVPTTPIETTDEDEDDGQEREESGVLDLTFVAAHLAPMEDGLQRRNEDWANIVRKLVFTPISIPSHLTSPGEPKASSSADENSALLPRPPRITPAGPRRLSDSILYQPQSHVFLAGDLNYRTSATPPSSDFPDIFSSASSDASSQWWSSLLSQDQLRQERKAGRTCHGFQEADITFPPTYKYSTAAQSRAAAITSAINPPGNESSPIETDTLSKSSVNSGEPPDASSGSKHPNPNPYAVHRHPSWCDRILYLPFPSWASVSLPSSSSASPDIKTSCYTSLPLLSTSDHQPVTLWLSVPQIPIPAPAPSSSSSTSAPTRATVVPSSSRSTSTSDDHSVTLNSSDPRLKPPFPIDPSWARKRAVARTLEVIVGALAWTTTTASGLVTLAVVFFSVILSLR
ncbi:MAG: hypothetical protein M1837_004587 [Sclerophora amabilis]|nr:MAG: hypothetical protein M1837_004587 [Sclerophora amabilis]